MLNCSLKNYIKSAILLLIAANSFGQTINNPSFEGSPGIGNNLSGWDECNQFSSPDVFPGSWNVTKQASNGNTYAGIVT